MVSNREKKTILIVTRWFPTPVEPIRCVFTKKMIDAQSSLSDGSNYILIVPIPYYPRWIPKLVNNKYFQFSRLPSKENHQNYQVHHPRYLKLPFKWYQRFEWIHYYFCVKNFIENKQIKFNIIHSHGLYPCGYVSAKLSKYFNISFVQHLHDSEINIAKKWMKDYYNYIIETARSLIAVSKKQKNIILNNFGNYSSKKIKIIYNGVDLKQFKHNKGYSLSHNYDKVNIVSVGNLIKGKRFDLLIRAISKLNNQKIKYYLTIIGDGLEKKSLLNLTNNLNAKSYIKLIGPVVNEKLNIELSKHDIFSLTTREETFGIVFLEAMACGLPVVAPRIKPLTEFIDEDAGVFFTKYTIESIAKAIQVAEKRSWDIKKVIQNAEKYSIETVALKIEQLYNFN